MKPFKRIERYLWSDVAMCSKDDTHWQYFNCHISLPSTTPAIPARWKATLAGTFAAGDTVTIGETVYTCTQSEELTNVQFAPGEADDVVTRLAAINPTVTGFSTTYDYESIYFTESVAGTGTAPTISVTGTNASVDTVAVRAYTPANAGLNEVQLIPGDLLIVDTAKGVNGYDENGEMYVKPINVAEYVSGTTKIAGFCIEFYTLDATDHEDIPVCVANCQLVKERLPKVDLYGNTISYELTSPTDLVAELLAMNFRFGKIDQGGLY